MSEPKYRIGKACNPIEAFPKTTRPLDVECPVCGAAPDAGCFSRYQPQFPSRTHVQRWKAAGLPKPTTDERIAVDVAYKDGVGVLGHLNAEDRARMFIDWCAIQGFPSKAGWPAGAYEQLVAHIRQSERPFPLKD